MTTSQIATTSQAAVAEIVDSIATRKRFVISSHSRPDGDSIGSQLAMAFALRALGKEVPGGILWGWIGTHAEYERLLS